LVRLLGGPEKAGGGGSIPSLATTTSTIRDGKWVVA